MNSIVIFYFKCLNKGKIENFGVPIDLINDESTILFNLIQSLDKAEQEKLIEIAKESALRNKICIKNFVN